MKPTHVVCCKTWIQKILTTLVYLVVSVPVSTSVFAQSTAAQSQPQQPHEVTSEVCSTCHKEIYAEWKSSMHAQSSALSDPIHAAFYRKVMGDPLKEGVTNAKGKYPVCLNCHAPNAAMQKKTKLDSAASFDEGVSCIFCHTISGFKGTKTPDGKLRLGASAYEISTTALQSPSGRQFTTGTAGNSAMDQPFHPFPMEAGDQAMIKTDAICMGCHDRRNNSHGVPLCITGDEIVESNTGVSCQSCHMATVDGHASHTMAGGHDVNTIRRGVFMSVDLNATDGGVLASINLTNRLPHRFPTGAPFRNVVIKVAAYNDNGEMIWNSPEVDPFKEESESVLAYRLGDADGNPSGPPPARQALSDTRLMPHEQRAIEYTIPVSGVKTVKADMYYSLLWPYLNKQLDDKLSDDLKLPKHVATAQASL